MNRRSTTALAAATLLARAALADPAPSPDQIAFFESKIRPILVQNCYKCHSHEAEKLKANLSVEFREALLKGGENGPAIVPGDPDKSLLIKAVRYADPDLQMPPKDKKLSDDQIDALVQWVKMGAPDPRSAANMAGGQTWGKNRKDHWAFKPILKEPVPTVKNSQWVANPVDAFILAKLEENNMKPSPPADRRALIRRATYDLIGLPPTPEEVDAFVNDTSTNAYAKVVDRLLASPQYGEHWGRYWLDVARYADTKGDVKQFQDVPIFPYAWTYRDYVVKSFNDDKPFNRFIMEQIAGDRLQLTDKQQGTLAALGFLTLGPRFNDNINDIINDRIDVVCKGFLGLTVTCARCHDHKFDPIPTADYYALRGVFISSVEPATEPLLGTLNATPEYQAFETKDNNLNQQLTTDEAKFRVARKKPGSDEFKDLRREIGQIRRQIVQLELNDPGSPPRATALYDSSKPQNSPIFVRGEVENKGPVVPRHFLSILSGPNPLPFKYGSGRLELAQDIANPANPLTARVLVNRVWLRHFGQGFVTTPDDFGNQSDPPSHPELLDYLAARFMNEGWSIKKLHRLIMLSNTYQESSENNARYAQQDPQNRLLWRANIHRLEFEAIRDSILAIGGQLDLTVGGKPIQLGAGGYSHRRTLYGTVDRRNLPEIYGQFDFANPDIETGKRYETTVPQQALFMMNSPLVVELARKLVNQKDFQDIPDEPGRIAFLYERIYQREPSDIEVKLGREFIDDSPLPEQITAEARDHLRDIRNSAKPGPPAAGKKRPAPPPMSLANISPDQLRPIGSWVKYAHALLQANEAIFVN